MDARKKMVKWALEQLKAPVLMGGRGDLRFNRETRTLLPHGYDFNIWDCSGLVCGAMHFGAGTKDMRGTHNAQMLHDETREIGPNEPHLLGDLAFYGRGPDRIIHVGIVCVGDRVISADGATWGIVSLEVAKSSRCMVRLHESPHFRGDFVCVRRNTFLDAIDAVSR